MNTETKYIQYSKLFVSISGIAYLVQVFLTIYLVCTNSCVSSSLIEILGTTTGLVGIIFGCYSGNSAAEKYIRGKTATGTQTASSQSDSNG